MAAGDITQGRRREDGTPNAELEPGDYCRRGTMWWISLPTGIVGHIQEPEWSIIEHDDGTVTAGTDGRTITVNPSIHHEQGWHGYLERGVWRKV